MPTLITRDYAVTQKRGYTGTGPFFASLIGSLNGEPDQIDAAMLQKRDGKFSELRVWVETTGNIGTGYVILCRKPDGDPWIETDLRVTIAGGGQPGLYHDNTHSVDFFQEDLLCWKIVPAASTGNVFSLRSIVVKVSDQT